jgi:hypothetical protein
MFVRQGEQSGRLVGRRLIALSETKKAATLTRKEVTVPPAQPTTR